MFLADLEYASIKVHGYKYIQSCKLRPCGSYFIKNILNIIKTKNKSLITFDVQDAQQEGFTDLTALFPVHMSTVSTVT